ncbi:YdeI/OmpD-associated family protein [Marinobacter sp. JSM 1782161]|uniref:YdeI/OmpD-associated family protein n=1 Tax=Marinobacter sp. JSM 1782161 TaxID=2685906 RepID=UPI0014020669|nr:YdeI/OmpD-associated family protein [Marinobacter sp. JSM 1782161]
MSPSDTPARFQATILRPAKPDGDAAWAFVVLPKSASDTLPRRGRTTVDVTLNGHGFQATLDPDGQLSHWLRLGPETLKSADVAVGETASFEIAPVAQEPEPDIPPDFQAALAAAPEARAVWEVTTPIARLDWIHWMTSAKQARTRTKRIHDACDMLASGKKRVCCFDPSGYYSKALSAPKALDEDPASAPS